MIRFLILPVIALLIVSGELQGQKAEFYKEEITFAILDNFFYVNGVYFVKADRTIELPLVYPFPVDSLYDPVDSIMMFNRTTNLPIADYKETANGVLFVVHIDSAATTEIWISYRQRLNAHQAEYILLSTTAWQKPLQEASYRLLVPVGQEITHFSIDPDTVSIHGDIKIYHWERKNYLPDRNMIFKFNKPVSGKN